MVLFRITLFGFPLMTKSSLIINGSIKTSLRGGSNIFTGEHLNYF